MVHTGVMFAFFIPPEIGAPLIELAQAAGLQNIPAVEDLHLTLHYLGEVADLEAMRDKIETAATWFTNYSAYDVVGKLSGVGRFNAKEGQTRTPVYASFDSATLTAFRNALGYELSWQDVQVNNTHVYTAHITLGDLDASADMPDITVPTTEITFKELVLAFGDTRTTYTFTRKGLITTMTKDGRTRELRREFQIVESEKQDRPTGRTRILVEMVGVTEIGGNPPKIALPTDVIRKANESDPDPVFVTLPVGQFNSRSRNNRNYTENAMRNMHAQIIERRPEGRWGHLDDWEFGTRYDPPAIRWLNAMIDPDGIIWAIGRALTPESQNYYRNAKLDNALVGTSLFAYAEMDGDDVISLDLISIDIAEPARVGVPMTAAKPLVTTEMAQQRAALAPESGADTSEAAGAAASQTGEDARQNPTMHTTETASGSPAGTTEGSQPPGGVLSEQSNGKGENMAPETNTPAATSTPVMTQEQVTALQAQITEQKTVVTSIRELVGATGDADVVAAVKAVLEARTALETENKALLEEALKSAVEAKVKTEAGRALVMDFLSMNPPKTRAAIAESITAILTKPHIKEALRNALVEEMGEAVNLGKPAGEQGEGSTNKPTAEFVNIPPG